MKKIKLSVLISTALLLIATNAKGVHAEEQTPTDNVLETDASVTFKSGPGSILKLVSTPDLNFGSVNIEEGVNEFTLAESENPQVTVHDFRGTGAKWELTANLSEFELKKEGETPEPSLYGASITFDGGDIVAPLEEEYKPSIIGGKLTSGEVGISIMMADQGEGLGVTTLNWLPSDIELYVPHKTMITGEHTATITWTLSDTI